MKLSARFNLNKIAIVTRFARLLSCAKRARTIAVVSGIATLLMSVSLVCAVPKRLYNTAAGTQKNAKNDVVATQKAADDAVDFCLRASAFGEQKAQMLAKAGAEAFMGKDKSVGETGQEEAAVFATYSSEKPPKLTVKAIMKVSGKICACVDIEGIAEGVMLAPGMEFLNNGHIIAVKDNAIEWTWAGKAIKTEF